MKYRDMNKEQKKAYHKAYYEAHKEELKKASNENYHANSERNTQTQKAYYKKNRDRIIERNKKYRQDHPEESKQRAREYSKTHKREAKNTKLKLYYGITIEHYEDMYSEQEGKCAICGIQQESLVVDHDHETGKVRKLLCKKCNLALGYVNDDPRIIENMLYYLAQEY